MKQKQRQKPYWKMTAAELAEATKEFDQEIPAAKLRPMNKQERERWSRAKRGPVRSIFVIEGKGKGTEAIVLELDSQLLGRLDAYARTQNMTRSQLIEKGLRSVLAFVEETPVRKPSRRSA
jgi:hypothetical protein